MGLQPWLVGELCLLLVLLMPAVASAHAGVMNSGVETGELKKAVPRHAFLNVINEYKHTEGAVDLYVETEPEDNSDAEEHHDMDTGLEDLDPTDDLEDEQVGESDDD